MKAFLPKTIAALMIVGVTSFWEGAGAWAQTSSNAGIVRPEYADQSTTAGCSSQGCDSACSQQERTTFGDWLWPSNYGCPYWSVTAEATAMQRSAPRNQSLFRQTLSQTDQLNAKDLNFPVSMGFQLSAIRHNVGGSGWDFEVAYAQMDGFEADADIAGERLFDLAFCQAVVFSFGAASFDFAACNGRNARAVIPAIFKPP